MQNAGQQYCQGGATSHQTPTPNFGNTEPTPATNNGGSTTSSLRQFRRKIEDKHQNQDTSQRQIPESHVARVAPQNHYPPRTSECYRYPNQYPDYSYSVPSQVKYSEISEPTQPLHDHISPSSVIQKAKSTKDYMEICNPSPHVGVVKQPYNDLHNMNNQQQPYNDGTVMTPQAQYIPKDTQVHPLYKPESQYFPKEPQYPAQLQHQMQKYNMPPAAAAQMRKFPPSDNEFLSKLQQINPMVARSIMSDHHLQEPQKTYQNLDQNRMYPMHHNQRYMNHPASAMQPNHYPHPAAYLPPQSYNNYASSCTYARSPQMTQPRFPTMSPHDRSISPRRTYSDSMSMSMNYPGMQPKISPNYPQYNTPDFAQHYQQRRPPITQDYYQQQLRPTHYMPHQVPAQEIPESRVTVSDSIKQYIENWADEETATEMNQLEATRFSKDLRVRDDQLSETVYTINASELQYLEPLGETENGIPLVSIDNASGMIRIVEKSGGQVDIADQNGDRIVNVHIMEPTGVKSDCMLASNKPNETNQRLNNEEPTVNNGEKPRVVIHQNTVIQSCSTQSLNLTKDVDQTSNGSQQQTKVGTSLPIITDEQDTIEELKRTIIKDCKIEVVDKNCSPINMEEIQAMKEDRDFPSDPVTTGENELFPDLGLPILDTSHQEQKDGELKEKEATPIDQVVAESNKEEKDSAIVEKDDKEQVEKPEEKTIEHLGSKGRTKQSSKEPNNRRSRRIFSVDDIINNVGETSQKAKRDTERRHSLHSVLDFLDKEIKSTFLLDLKTGAHNVSQTNESARDMSKTDDDACDVSKTDDDRAETSEEKCEENSKVIPKSCLDENAQEMQYRQVIKVEESNVLLHIAGELVEINVANINGKKVITVTPMSSTTLVDFNDNYETLDPEAVKFESADVDREESQELTVVDSAVPEKFTVNSAIPEELTVGNMVAEELTVDSAVTEELTVDSVVAEADCVEPSSEVVIGMDLSLEEEIKLDVEQPPMICTKAAKKAYDNDLQIPSITTSEDINNQTDKYNSNDKVSSSKEKPCKDSSEETEDVKEEKSEREKLREFRKIKHPSLKDVVEGNKEEEDDDDFVPFKELIKARKMKKMKMLEKKNEEIVKADSTNKDDEIIRESAAENKDSKNLKIEDKKKSSTKMSKDKVKKYRTSGSNDKTTIGARRKDRSEGRSKEKRRRSEKNNKEKSRSDKKKEEIGKVSSEQGDQIGVEVLKSIPSPKDEKEPHKIAEVKGNKDCVDAVEVKENPAIVEVEKGMNEPTTVNCVEPPNEHSEENAVGVESEKSIEETSSNKSVSASQSESSEGKKKLTLEEYINRKRKSSEKNRTSPKKIKPSDQIQSLSAMRSQRPKSLDDLDTLKESKPSKLALKRKSSLGSISAPTAFDWEETQSPKSDNLDVKEKTCCEFRGLITKNDKSNAKSVINHLEDRILQTYKEKVESKLSSLNFRIPKPTKVSCAPEDGAATKVACVSENGAASKSETSGLMQRFLKSDRLTATEMDKIKKIISYKRLIQQFKKPNPESSKTDSSTPNKETIKLHQKKPSSSLTKKKKKRFRNLYGDSSSENNTEEEDVSSAESKLSSSGDYSVVQSNCLAGVVPKLIIKRKQEMPLLPFVKLERLNLDALVHDKRVCIE